MAASEGTRGAVERPGDEAQRDLSTAQECVAALTAELAAAKGAGAAPQLREKVGLLAEVGKADVAARRALERRTRTGLQGSAVRPLGALPPPLHSRGGDGAKTSAIADEGSRGGDGAKTLAIADEGSLRGGDGGKTEATADEGPRGGDGARTEATADEEPLQIQELEAAGDHGAGARLEKLVRIEARLEKLARESLQRSVAEALSRLHSVVAKESAALTPAKVRLWLDPLAFILYSRAPLDLGAAITLLKQLEEAVSVADPALAAFCGLERAEALCALGDPSAALEAQRVVAQAHGVLSVQPTYLSWTIHWRCSGPLCAVLRKERVDAEVAWHQGDKDGAISIVLSTIELALMLVGEIPAAELGRLRVIAAGMMTRKGDHAGASRQQMLRLTEEQEGHEADTPREQPAPEGTPAWHAASAAQPPRQKGAAPDELPLKLQCTIM